MEDEEIENIKDTELKKIKFIKYQNMMSDNDSDLTFNDFILKEKNGKKIFSINKKNEYDLLIIKNLNKSFKKIYKVKQNNRDVIIDQIIQILKSKYSCFYILRTDIKQFYETINREALIEKIIEPSFLIDPKQKIILSKLFKKIKEQSLDYGLPRGISLSSTLSEKYMERFDKEIMKNKDVYYYARFVDDIIIFSNKEIKYEKAMLTINDTNIELEKGLIFNKDKTDHYIFNKNDNKKHSIEYLGYNFLLNTPNKDDLTIKISQKKIEKIIKRVGYSLEDYKKNLNKKLLIERMLFLSASYKIKNKLNAGILYNYKFITISENKNFEDSLEELDKEFQKILENFKKDCLDEAISGIKNISFKKFFYEKKYKYFSKKRILLIKKCWENE